MVNLKKSASTNSAKSKPSSSTHTSNKSKDDNFSSLCLNSKPPKYSKSIILNNYKLVTAPKPTTPSTTTTNSSMVDETSLDNAGACSLASFGSHTSPRPTRGGWRSLLNKARNHLRISTSSDMSSITSLDKNERLVSLEHINSELNQSTGVYDNNLNSGCSNNEADEQSNLLFIREIQQMKATTVMEQKQQLIVNDYTQLNSSSAVSSSESVTSSSLSVANPIMNAVSSVTSKSEAIETKCADEASHGSIKRPKSMDVEDKVSRHSLGDCGGSLQSWDFVRGNSFLERNVFKLHGKFFLLYYLLMG
jgi:hypothetical protein